MDVSVAMELNDPLASDPSLVLSWSEVDDFEGEELAGLSVSLSRRLAPSLFHNELRQATITAAPSNVVAASWSRALETPSVAMLRIENLWR